MPDDHHEPAEDGSAAQLQEFQRAWTELINAAIHARTRSGQCRAADELTLTQTLLMEAVRGLPDPTVGSVAKVVGVSSPSATRMIQQLERKGMMARRRAEHDERRTVVAITEEGERVLAERRLEMECKQRRIFDAIDPALRPTVLEVLHGLREAMDQA
ncbi:DNA-binding MarR family transcriptional regulator [Nocardiopsis sp. Huas11]|uniref:MarR family winged helix-turn-helix transcriptional regulator n=1 Tax=Nocardiopsis sp. Huas11 TaxID=2183912 RepID=UPI000EB4313C|nr:MarR family winged helix-turn-helix transcriptional regulator [Nocardiopsis sp. Huas11]RKS07306.1 DNA-binding MarR family transcriptional regulator [Nocardiopsis sp. Huas11]